MTTITHFLKQFSDRHLQFKDKPAIAVGIVLTAILLYSVTIAAYPTIIYPWYSNTEEFPYIQEIIRFSAGDFRQEFFDIPGTPLMAIGTLLWSSYYWLLSLLGNSDTTQGIRYFSFKHMQELYLLMRIISYLFYILSVVLTYKISARLTNWVGGLVSALMLALSPIYSQTLWHLRIESTSLGFVLLAVWLILLALEHKSYKLYLLSGVMAGLAMATRYPSISAGIPILLFYCAFYPHVFTNQIARRINQVAFGVIVLCVVIGGGQALLVKSGLLAPNFLTDFFFVTSQGDHPKAIAAIQKLWILLLFTIAPASLFLYLIPKTRGFFQHLVHSSAITVSTGFIGGLFLGLPTILWSKEYFLSALEAFSTRNQATQPLMENFFNVVYFFMFGALNMSSTTSLPPEVGIFYLVWDTILFFIGLFLIVFRRIKFFYPIVLVAILGISVQYGKLQTTRHIIAWLPYFLCIIALPVAVFYEKLKLIFQNKKIIYRLFPVALLVFVFITGYKMSYVNLLSVKTIYHDKIMKIHEMDQWLNTNLQASDRVFHVCCEPVNQDAILSWMQSSGIKVPKGVQQSERSKIWFGDKETLLAAQQGYIVIGKLSFQIPYIDYYKKIRPESVTDPFNDPTFKLETEVPGEFGNSFIVYSFDFRSSNPKKSEL